MCVRGAVYREVPVETRLMLAYGLLVILAFATMGVIAVSIRRRRRRRRMMRGWRPH
jgi:hypothetical protein